MTGPSPVDRGKSGSNCTCCRFGREFLWPWAFRQPTPTMPRRCARWCGRSRRSGRGAVRAGGIHGEQTGGRIRRHAAFTTALHPTSGYARKLNGS